MTTEDADRLKAVLSGTALKLGDETVTCRSGRISFQNSGGMLADLDGVYGDTPILCSVDIYLAGDLSIAVATIGTTGKNILGRITVARGKATEVEPVLDDLMTGRYEFVRYFTPVVYQHPGIY
jgi:hypothetical protein